ncbi:MAG: hypothetical protein DWH91_07045 [Planctomycetota bacterium]|nr:MAG: hypothetical protein DWH91_07045 [Planctomycetota bacterium]
MHHSRILAWPVLRYGLGLALLLSTLSGCEVGRSFFQMSSDSPVPFFGVDLMPRRKTSQYRPDRPALSTPAEGLLVTQPRTPEVSVLMAHE